MSLLCYRDFCVELNTQSPGLDLIPITYPGGLDKKPQGSLLILLMHVKNFYKDGSHASHSSLQ